MKKIFYLIILCILSGLLSSCESLCRTLNSTGRALDGIGNCMNSAIRLGKPWTIVDVPPDSLEVQNPIT